MKSKALFISFALGLNNTGGQKLSLSNLKYVKNHHKNCNVDIIYFKFKELSTRMEGNYLVLEGYENKFTTLYNSLLGFMGGMSLKNEKIILKKIKNKNYSIIYFDSSLYGRTIKKIKKLDKKIHIITFFHNVEFDFFKAKLKSESIFFAPLLVSSFFNERSTVKHSDKKIALTSKDQAKLNIIYKASDIDIIPLSIEDDFSVTKLDRNLILRDNKLLFVGSSFFGNREGLLWFIKGVLPFVDYELHIVGKGWENIIGGNKKKIKILGYIENLQDVYDSYSTVIAPILSGSGMKTKIVEAFMYAKFVIGTNKAFDGFNGITEEFTQVCDTKMEFIQFLNNNKNTYRHIYNLKSRDYYNKYLSPNVCQIKFNKIINELKIDENIN